jgi:protein required for attachment to host cells
MQTNWIVLANASRARVCGRDPDSGRLDELADLVHPQSRQKGSALDSDRGGHAQQGHGGADRHGTTLDAREDPRHKAHAQFARELADYVERAITEGRCTGWTLMASDPFLGELKAHLGKGAQKALQRAVARDMTSFDGADLEQHVRDALRPG